MRINDRVMIMREAITKIVPMLSSKQIRVTQQGMQAFVEYDPLTKEPKRVNVPYLPDDCSDELLDAVQGFIDHEVGHILYSDARVLDDAIKAGKTVKFLANVIEDPRIETRMQGHFQGSAYNLSNTARFFLREVIGPHFKVAVQSGDKVQIVNALTVPAIRAWAGQRDFIEYMKDKWHHMEEFKNAVGQDLIDQIPKMNSSRETLDLAIEFNKRLGGKDEPEEEQPEEGKGEKGKGKPAKGEGKPKAPGKPDDKSKDEAEGTGAGSGDEDDTEEQAEESDEDGLGNVRPKMNLDDLQKLGSALADQSDYDEAMGEALAARAEQEAKSSDYVIFTKDDDKMDVMEPSKNAFDRLKEMQDEVDGMIGPMQKDIERMMAARSAVIKVGGFKSGALHSAALTRHRFGKTNLFRRKQENHTKDVAVEIVCDFSGSMQMDGKLRTAVFSAYGIAAVLDRLGISNEVIGFTTGKHSPAVAEALNKALSKGGVDYARHCSLNMPILKEYTDHMTGEVRARFMEATIRGGLSSANIDGESVMLAYRRLAVRKETRKVMLVFSDGQPAGHGSGDFDGHLKATVKKIEASGVDVVGLGIMDESVRKFYSRNVIMKHVNELPAIVMGQLKDLLVQ